MENALDADTEVRPFADRRAIALALIEAGCVTARADEPFRLPSGWATPVYMDCRRLIAFPVLRRRLVATGLTRLQRGGALDGLQGIVGAETSGIALAAWMADRLDLPLHFVRKKAAGQRPLEGALRDGDKVLLVDDLMAAGYSKRRFIDAIRSAGARVQDVFVVFDYGTFDNTALLNSMDATLHGLADWRDVLAVAVEHDLLSAEARLELQDFIRDPSAWSEAHSGIGTTRVQN